METKIRIGIVLAALAIVACGEPASVEVYDGTLTDYEGDHVEVDASAEVTIEGDRATVSIGDNCIAEFAYSADFGVWEAYALASCDAVTWTGAVCADVDTDLDGIDDRRVCSIYRRGAMMVIDGSEVSITFESNLDGAIYPEGYYHGTRPE